MAASNGNVDLVKLLCASGADVNAQVKLVYQENSFCLTTVGQGVVGISECADTIAVRCVPLLFCCNLDVRTYYGILNWFR